MTRCQSHNNTYRDAGNQTEYCTTQPQNQHGFNVNKNDSPPQNSIQQENSDEAQIRFIAYKSTDSPKDCADQTPLQ